ncbi:MAG TPA: hypothetical protein ENN23_08510 [Deltaproteobacteria bacterium]|nr:hypothetical protein [Deltaproteobacteria bacterium]
MEKYKEIIDKIQKQKTITPPDDLTDKIMAGAQKAETSFQYKLYRTLFQRRQLSPDAKGIITGKIFSPVQCFFLLFVVGLFYLLMGLFVIFGMNDFLANTNINLWLRFQPYLAITSGVFIIFLAFLVRGKPQKIDFAKYGIIAHSIFIIINALILEFIFVFPVALAFSLSLSVLAVFLGILMVSSINSYIKSESVDIRGQLAQNV